MFPGRIRGRRLVYRKSRWTGLPICKKCVIITKRVFLPARVGTPDSTGVDGCWCAPWSSKPVMGVRSLLGGFDSHIFPPDKRPCNHCDCGAFVFIYEKRAALLAQPFLVLVTGIEPVRVLPHGILSPGRLPVPPHQPVVIFSIS